MKTYTLHITRQQALTLQVACEVLARLGIGQFRDALDHLPTREFRPHGWHEDMDAIGAILSKHTIQSVDGWRHSLGISNDKTSNNAKDAWDLYTVIRHRLSWDAAMERGDIQPGEPRKWTEMMGVNYDEPMRHGKEPLARISADAAAAQGDACLWCVHVQGHDGVYAMPSRAAALERANKLNELFGRHPYEEGDPIMRAVVIEWPHSANAHKQDLADAARTVKHAADRAYQVHHASCSACQAAGKNSALQRCPQGRQLWDAAIDAAREAQKGGA